jgi:uncharacterized protein YkwD
MKISPTFASTSSGPLLAVLSMLIAGCGGGGGGGASVSGGAANNGANLPVTDSATSPIINAALSSNYIDEDLKAFNLLNAERDRCGFGKLAQNAKLDVMARGHVNWIEQNNGWGHVQIAGTPGFTGVSVQDRATNAGYGPSARISEGMGSFILVESDSRGVRRLLNAPYHQLDMLRGYRDIGVGIPLTGPNRYILLNYGTLPPETDQAPTANTVRTYPCDGSTGVERIMDGETPNPVPTRGLGIDPLGTSIAVVGDLGKQITVTSATMTGPGGVAVTLRAPSNSLSDPNQGYLRINEAYVLADAPLSPNTTYQVFLTGTNGTVPFSRSFSFTTTVHTGP